LYFRMTKRHEFVEGTLMGNGFMMQASISR
jgi:hypothetical protein